MERLTAKYDNGYLFALPPKNDEKALEEYVDKLSIKLGEYEDLEEQGLLLRLPCKVGDTVWCIEEFEDGFEYSGYKFMAMCGEFVIVTPKYSNCDFKEQLHEMERESREWEGISVDMFKKENVFLTKEEAEQALERMKEM